MTNDVIVYACWKSELEVLGHEREAKQVIE